MYGAIILTELDARLQLIWGAVLWIYIASSMFIFIL